MKLAALPLEALQPLLASGELSAGALMTDCLQAIREHDDRLRAMLAIALDAADEARARDAQRSAGEAIGPLHGLPIAVKDNIDVAGLPTTSGCRALARARPRSEAATVTRLREAGAIIIGKANLSELSFEIRSRSSLGGDTINPFLAGATSGGSSGGVAVAIAAGYAVAGLGTDTGGSIRVPASYNGLTGLRPTHGRIGLDGTAPLAPSTDTLGLIARSVGDVAALWAVITASPVESTGGPVAGLRVGMLRQAFGPVAEIVRATEAAASALREAGVAVVDPVLLPDADLPRDGAHIVDVEFADAFDAYLTSNFVEGTAPPSLAAILASGDYLPDHEPALRRRVKERSAGRAEVLARHTFLRTALERAMAEHGLDALLHPTSMVVPETLDNPKGGWAPELAACSGWPALSLPSGRRSASGVPIGVELLARRGEEALLFRIGSAIERAAGPRAVPSL